MVLVELSVVVGDDDALDVTVVDWLVVALVNTHPSSRSPSMASTPSEIALVMISLHPLM